MLGFSVGYVGGQEISNNMDLGLPSSPHWKEVQYTQNEYKCRIVRFYGLEILTRYWKTVDEIRLKAGSPSYIASSTSSSSTWDSNSSPINMIHFKLSEKSTYMKMKKFSLMQLRI